MKEAGTVHWLAPNTGANNSSGFTALPGGIVYADGSISGVGKWGSWWTSSEIAGGLRNWSLSYSSGYLYRSSAAYPTENDKHIGMSIRLIKD